MSLLAVLDNVDYQEYSVDLLLFSTKGPLTDLVPPQVRIHASSGYLDRKRLIRQCRRAMSPKYVAAWTKGELQARLRGRKAAKAQMLGLAIADFLPQPTGVIYDSAIAFLEFGPVAFVAALPNTRSRIAWIHTDYEASGALPSVEDKVLSAFDRIVLVSPSCVDSFERLYPSSAGRTQCIENIVSRELLERRNIHEDDPSLMIDADIFRSAEVQFVTVARIDFASKGQDRALRAFHEISKSTSPHRTFHWWVIGDGPDSDAFCRMIAELHMLPYVSWLGALRNPFSLMSRMDLFLLPSRYEGKPIAITEAQMLGLPVLASRYGAVDSQVNNGIDGLVVENTEEGLYAGLLEILTDSTMLANLKLGAATSRRGGSTSSSEVRALLDEMAGG